MNNLCNKLKIELKEFRESDLYNKMYAEFVGAFDKTVEKSSLFKELKRLVKYPNMGIYEPAEHKITMLSIKMNGNFRELSF